MTLSNFLLQRNKLLVLSSAKECFNTLYIDSKFSTSGIFPNRTYNTTYTCTCTSILWIRNIRFALNSFDYFHHRPVFTKSLFNISHQSTNRLRLDLEFYSFLMIRLIAICVFAELSLFAFSHCF